MYCRAGHCLCRTMQARSRQIWNDLQDAEILNSPYHEDTITQSFALHLNRLHPAENRVHVFGQRAEGKNGSDFIWLFFDHDLSRYFPVAVQAKRLYANGRYQAFMADQVKKIRRYAYVAGALPIYLTYNYPSTVPNLWAVWRFRRPAWPVETLDYQRDLGLIYFRADSITHIADGKLSPHNVPPTGRPMWTAFCTCTASCTGDALSDLRKALIAQPVDADASYGGLYETPPMLRSWKSGEEFREEDLLEDLNLRETTVDQSFAPSFLLGTTLGNGRSTTSEGPVDL